MTHDYRQATFETTGYPADFILTAGSAGGPYDARFILLLDL